jgi:hypothetical protein
MIYTLQWIKKMLSFQPLDLFTIRETYNSMELFAALTNESLSSAHPNARPVDICGGRKLKSLTVNRTFDFPSGLVEVHADGSRQADLLLYSFRLGQRTMQVSYNKKAPVLFRRAYEG